MTFNYFELKMIKDKNNSNNYIYGGKKFIFCSECLIFTLRIDKLKKKKIVKNKIQLEKEKRELKHINRIVYNVICYAIYTLEMQTFRI